MFPGGSSITPGNNASGGGGGNENQGANTENGGFGNVGGKSLNNDAFGKPKMVAFKYNKESAATGELVSVALVVPLLCIVPVPVLTLKSMTLSFNVRLEGDLSKSYSKTTKDNSASGLFGVSASLAKQGTSRSGSNIEREYSLDIKLTIVQDEVPMGIERMTSILESSLKEIVLQPDAGKDMLKDALEAGDNAPAEPAGTTTGTSTN